MQQSAEEQQNSGVSFDPFKPAEKVAIIGKAPSSRQLAPYDPKDGWSIWTLSDLVLLKQVPRFDRHFEIHPLDWFTGPGNPRAPYLEWLKGVADKPIYMQRTDPSIPCSLAYPVHDIIDAFGPYRYFTNTVTWMVAMAIACKAEAIGVWGVDMAQDGPKNGEYQAQRPSCEWILGYAMGRGIDVYVPPQSDLFKATLLYGFQTDGGAMREKFDARAKELTERIAVAEQKHAQLQQQEQQLFAKIHQLHGARESLSYHRQQLPQPWQ
jgi:hypothetical protein